MRPGERAAELGIGTVELGVDYGVRRRPRPTRAEALAILGEAASGGIRVFDTAPAYGDAEPLLGEALHGLDVDIVTKTTPGESPRRSLEASLVRLRRETVHGLLVHHSDDLLRPGGDRVAAELAELRAEGLAERIGASVYSPDELDAVRRVLDTTIVQLPMSVLDQRFAQAGHLASLVAEGCAVHTRSVLLQGALAHDALPRRLMHLDPHVRRFHAAAASIGEQPADVALAFGLRQTVDVVLLGVASREELSWALAVRDRASAIELDAATSAELSVRDPTIVDPRRWPE